MELHKKSELSVGRTSFVISTQLAGDASPSIETIVTASDGGVVFETSQDISTLKPIFQNSQQIYARLEAQHHSVVKELQQGRIPEGGRDPGNSSSEDRESDALAHAVSLLGKKSFEKATAAFRAVLDTYPNCSEARELLEVAYKARSEARLPIDVVPCLRRGIDAFAGGRQREAIESWKQCLTEEPDNRHLQLLLLIATTWSRARREIYAAEVLGPSGDILSSGRPEETEALLLVTQTVEMSAAPQPGVEQTGSSTEQETMVVAPPFDEALIDNLIEAEKSNQPSSSTPESVPVSKGPIADEPARRAVDLDETVVTPSTSSPAPPATAPSPSSPARTDRTSGAVADRTSPQTSSETKAGPTSATPGSVLPPTASAVPSSQPASPSTSSETAQAQAQTVAKTATPASAISTPTPASAASGSRPAMARRPHPRVRRSNPWPMVGAGAAALLVIGGVAFWLLSGDKSVPPARLEQAASLVSAGQYPQAIAAYDTMLGEFGDDPSILLGRGRAKLASGDNAGGLGDLKRAETLDSESGAIAEEIGDVLYSQGNFPDAIGYYQKAIAKGQASAEGRYRLAVSLVREGRADEALEHLKQVIAKQPAHGEAQFLYGELLNERGRYQEAEKALRAAEPNVEAGSDYLSQLGIALLEQQKLDDAEEVARQFIRGYPNDARARSLLGEVYLSRKQYEPARAQLIQALRTDPREPRAQIALGRTWLAIGKARNDAQDLAKAQQVLTKAQGVHEGNRLLALGQVALAEGQLDVARGELEQSLRNGAPELPVHLSLAEVKWRGNDPTGTAEELQRASDLAPGDPAIALSLAIVYYQMKDLTRAGDEFLKAIQGIGLLSPPGEGAGPVVLPPPHIPLPDRFNLNRAIKDCYQTILKQTEDDPTATELRTLSESATFIVAGPS